MDAGLWRVRAILIWSVVPGPLGLAVCCWHQQRMMLEVTDYPVLLAPRGHASRWTFLWAEVSLKIIMTVACVCSCRVSDVEWVLKSEFWPISSELLGPWASVFEEG